MTPIQQRYIITQHRHNKHKIIQPSTMKIKKSVVLIIHGNTIMNKFHRTRLMKYIKVKT